MLVRLGYITENKVEKKIIKPPLDDKLLEVF